VRAAGRSVLTPPEARDICEAYGLPVPKEGLASSVEEAVRLARDIGFPVALKIVSPDIVHKTEAGGVQLGVSNAREVRQAYRTITANAWNYRSDARITGVQVQHMVTGGNEVIVGIIRDPAFGPVVMFGLGGVFVEVLRDVALRVAPLSRLDATDMLDEIRGRPLLDGARGHPPIDREALVEALCQLGDFLLARPWIESVDLNPVLGGPAGLTAVDARVVLSP
jgi:succinyl-CoA synthetase beta subunit